MKRLYSEIKPWYFDVSLKLKFSLILKLFILICLFFEINIISGNSYFTFNKSLIKNSVWLVYWNIYFI